MYNLQALKGIHPGAVLEKELKKRNLSKGRFAISIGEYPQTVGAIINGKRDMNTALSLKIESALNIEEGFFMTLQVYYDINKLKNQRSKALSPDLSIIRSALFWDTTINKINWEQQKPAVIKRVFERGNDTEKAEIIRFYGKEIVDAVINNPNIINNNSMSQHKQV